MLNLKESDLDFVIETVDYKLIPRKEAIKSDPAIIEAMLDKENEKLFIRLMSEEEVLLKISPRLLFDILLRRTREELKKATYTTERIGSQELPVFDPNQVVKLLAQKAILEYLVDMLSSFTRIESFVIPVRVRKGIWRKIRFKDMDVDSLIRFCEAVDEEHRFGFYKRIADVCLFILGVFPEYVLWDYRYPPGELRPKISGRLRRSAEEYEEEGRKFYQLAAEHQTAKVINLDEVFWQLHEKFNLAKKPLNFISQHYLHFKKAKLFDIKL